MLNRLYENESAYHTVWLHQNVAEARVTDFTDENGGCLTACDTQEEYDRAVQEESDAIKRNAEDFRMRTELTMNNEWVVHGLKILDFSEKLKQFTAHKKKFDTDEAHRLLRKPEWQRRENSERLKELRCSQQFTEQHVAAGISAPPAVPARSNPPQQSKMQQAAARAHQLSTTEQQRVRQEVLVSVNETAYQQLLANTTIEMHGSLAKALQTKEKRLHMEFKQTCPKSVVRRLAAAANDNFDVSADTSVSSSVPLPPLLPGLALSALIEPFEQRRYHCQKQLGEH